MTLIKPLPTFQEVNVMFFINSEWLHIISATGGKYDTPSFIAAQAG